MAERGFIVHRTYIYQEGSIHLAFIGRLESGETFASFLTDPKPGFYIRESDLQNLREGENYSPCKETTMGGAPLLRLEFQSLGKRSKAAGYYREKGIRLYESDLAFHDSYLFHHQIKGQINLEGSWKKGQRVSRVYKNPLLSPAEGWADLTTLSFDLETNPYGEEIWSFSMVLFGRNQQKEVVYYWPEGEKSPSDENSLADEKALLLRFRELLLQWDPDIITGWNIVDFDLPKLFTRMKDLKLPLDLGRSKEDAQYFPPEGNQGPSFQIPGRQVVDALRALRSGPEPYEDYKLETVARAVLNRGKEVSSEGEDKLQELILLRKNNPQKFCKYNLEDSRLVRDILMTTGLLELTIQRTALTGISLSKAWTSIAAFENLYANELHKRGMVLPDHGVDSLPVGDSLGGAIIPPKAGLYTGVLVFDFKSLYPTIIRTFNIDPLSYLPPRKYPDVFPASPREEWIEAPGGALFSREEAILPQVLSQFHHLREEAKSRGDKNASYVYKIIQNSIYGCLGSPGSRLAASDLAGSITGFGHLLLNWCKNWFMQKGYAVLYGDTDSLFIQSQLPEKSLPESYDKEGKKLCALLNQELKQFVEEQYQVKSVLELEFETIFAHLFLPTLRHSDDLSKGRAKGYAGLPWAQIKGEWKKEELVIKGMEAVRRDWTPLARNFQISLLKMMFHKKDQSYFADFIKQYKKELLSGKLDSQCEYTKMLRKPLSSYTVNRPPHVKAAELLPLKQQKGLIRYYITQRGPQPKGYDPIDYSHYIEKQLLPIAESIEEVLPFKLHPFLDQTGQLDLFGE